MPLQKNQILTLRIERLSSDAAVWPTVPMARPYLSPAPPPGTKHGCAS